MAQGSKLVNSLVALLFPPRCVGCDILLDEAEKRSDAALCPACKAEWDAAKQDTCGKCFSPISECRCMTELLEQSGCKAYVKLAYYQHGKSTPVANRVIYHIKNRRERRAPAFLARELARAIGEPSADTVITYIPRRRGAVLETGTDQARALAEALAKELDLSVCRCLHRRRGRELEQKKLTPAERWRNARTSYEVDRKFDLAGREVLLIDDIVTTGASLAACAKKLMRAGVSSVLCVSVATDDVNREPAAVPLIKHSL